MAIARAVELGIAEWYGGILMKRLSFSVQVYAPNA
jgi:hypothetical protein